jgi:hypothetical protein
MRSPYSRGNSEGSWSHDMVREMSGSLSEILAICYLTMKNNFFLRVGISKTVISFLKATAT